MIKTFTQDDVLRYLYNETTELETAEITQALIHDEELRAFYEENKKIIALVGEAYLEPSDAIMEKILKLG